MNKLILAAAMLLTVSCTDTQPDAQTIIDRAIEKSGGEKYLDIQIEFDFRDRHYIATRQGGEYSYERITQDSTGTIRDLLTNEGFRREVNGAHTQVADSMETRYSASINSVIYFALLPYGLNDPAVKKKLLGETIIHDTTYYKIEISFDEEGGGKDFEDTFIYWIHSKDFTVDYLAYSFEEKGVVDYRFRKAYHPQIVGGIRFQNYINYKPLEETTLEILDSLYLQHKLDTLSTIELKNIQVK